MSIMSEKQIIPDGNATRRAFAERLRQLMGQDSQRDFGQRIGVGQATLSQYVLAKTEPTWSTLVEIATITGCSFDWLMTGRGAAPDGTTSAVSDGERAGLYLTLKRYDVRASAGYGAKVFAEPPDSVLDFPAELLRGLSNDVNKLASIDVTGDSMVPTLADGEPIILDRASRQVDREAVYVLAIGDELFVKRVRRVPTAGGMMTLSLISDNPAYPEVTLDPETQERVRIIGRVVWPNTSRRL